MALQIQDSLKKSQQNTPTTQPTPQNTQAGTSTQNPSQTGSSANQVLAGTKVYANSQYHFQMNVPENDNLPESGALGFINFMKDANTLDLSIAPQTTTKTLKQNVDEFNSVQDNPKIQETNTTVAGVPAVKAIENLSKGGSNVWYLFVNNGTFYWLIKGPGLTNEQFDSMVSTFTFTK